MLCRSTYSIYIVREKVLTIIPQAYIQRKAVLCRHFFYPEYHCSDKIDSLSCYCCLSLFSTVVVIESYYNVHRIKTSKHFPCFFFRDVSWEENIITKYIVYWDYLKPLASYYTMYSIHVIFMYMFFVYFWQHDKNISAISSKSILHTSTWFILHELG